MSPRRGVGLKDKILLAALECCKGDTSKSFTMEELLVNAWVQDQEAWGLRGFEHEHPDSDKIQKEIGSRGSGSKSMIAAGFFQKEGRRIYRMTTKGIAAAAKIQPSDSFAQAKLGRVLSEELKRISDHPVFKGWLANPDNPKNFRDAGYFWGIAPGTPVKTVETRIDSVDAVLDQAKEFINNTNSISERRGAILFSQDDVDKMLQFHNALKKRFQKELSILRSGT